MKCHIFCWDSTHMQDLQEVTQDVHYENYRSERLAKGVASQRKASASNSAAPIASSEQTSDNKEHILQVNLVCYLIFSYFFIFCWFDNVNAKLWVITSSDEHMVVINGIVFHSIVRYEVAIIIHHCACSRWLV